MRGRAAATFAAGTVLLAATVVVHRHHSDAAYARSNRHHRDAAHLAVGTGPTQHQEPALPAPREETAAAALDGHLYVLGGFDVSGQDTATVFIFNGNTWSSGPRLPLAIDHASAAVLAGRMYLAGGFTYGRASDQVFVLSLSHHSWVRVGRLNDARGAFALVTSGQSMYAIGGKDGNGLEIRRGETYSPHTGRWTQISALPLPRDHLAGFSYRGWVCVAGGRSPNTTRVDCYVPHTRSWSRLPDLPVATSGAGASAINHGVIIGGGELATEGGGIISQLEHLNAGKWSTDRMLIPRHGIQFAPFQGRVWVCGGGIAPGLHPVSTCTSIKNL